MAGDREDGNWRIDSLTHHQALKLGLCPRCHRKMRDGECPTCDNRALFDPVSREARK